MTKNPVNGLFLCTLKVRPGAECEMPPNLRGAYVDCFVASPEHFAALRLAIETLRGQGYECEGLHDDKIHELDPQGWD